MSRSIEFSNFDVEQKYTISDIVPFAINARVENNELIITDTVGNDTNVGQYQGGLGDEVVDLQLNDGSLQQFYNNGLPSTFHGEVKRDRTLTYTHGGEGYFTGEIVDDLLAINQDENDVPLVIDGKVFYHIVPVNLDWEQSTSGRTLITSREGITLQVNRRVNNNAVYDLEHSINRNTSSNQRIQWSTAVSINSSDYYTMEFPYPIEMSGFRFMSLSGTYYMDSFSVELSEDGFVYDSPVIYNQTNANNHVPFVELFNDPVMVKKIRIKPIASPRAGNIKFFDPLTNHKPAFRRQLQYKPISFDQRYFDTIVDENGGTTVSIRDNLEDFLIPYDTGNVIASRYTKLESTTIPTAGSSYTIEFDNIVKNGARASLENGDVILKKGVYLIKSNAPTRAAGRSVSQIFNLNNGQMISSGLHSSTALSFSNAGQHRNSSAGISSLMDVIKLDQDTKIRLRCNVTTSRTSLPSMGITQNNEKNVFGTMEIWALNNEDFFNEDEIASGDQHWDDVVLLLNGENAWTDHSKYTDIVMECNGVVVDTGTDGFDGNEYDFFSTRNDLLISTARAENRYSSLDRDFTFEFSFTTFDSSINQVIYNNGVTSGVNMSYIQISNGRLNVYDGRMTSGIFELPEIPTLGDTINGEVVTVTDLDLSLLSDIEVNSIIIPSQWYHVSWCREDGVHYLYINGHMISQNDDVQFNPVSTQYIFGNNAIGDQKLNGRMRNIRMTIGTNRYSGNFVPPSQKITKDYKDQLND